MAVYVDELRVHAVVKPQASHLGNVWCHLCTDGTLEELHQFAELIGLKREWFQNHPTLPHYDLVPTKRMVAIRKGAIEKHSEEVVILCSLYFRRKRQKSSGLPRKSSRG